MTLDLYEKKKIYRCLFRLRQSFVLCLRVLPDKDLQLSSCIGIALDQSKGPCSSTFPFPGALHKMISPCKRWILTAFCFNLTLLRVISLELSVGSVATSSHFFNQCCCPHSLSGTVWRALPKKLSSSECFLKEFHLSLKISLNLSQMSDEKQTIFVSPRDNQTNLSGNHSFSHI